MEFNGRGFYNTLVFSSSGSKEKWQIDDYKKITTASLFEKLQKLNIPLNEASFDTYLQGADSPEDLTDILCPEDEGTLEHEQAYLVIFELWRRLYPQKESLSVFCDRLDHLIFDYDAGKEVEDDLVKVLRDLLKIFENFSSSGLSQKKRMKLSQVILLKI